MNNQLVKMTMIIVGSAMGGIFLFVAVISAIVYYKFNHSFEGPYDYVSKAPSISEKDRFYGTMAVYQSGFDHETKKMLTTGPARFTGFVSFDNGLPVVGLKISLALSGNVYSEWGLTDLHGQYNIPAPSGDYRVVGYRLNFDSANHVLGGKIDHPYNRHATDIISLKEGQGTRAIDLVYVDPVSNISPKGQFSLSRDNAITWDRYPGAAYYKVQIVEKKNPIDYKSYQDVFEWEKRPMTDEPSFDLIKHGVDLKKDFYYSVEIEAMDHGLRILSKTRQPFNGVNFFVVD